MNSWILAQSSRSIFIVRKLFEGQNRFVSKVVLETLCSYTLRFQTQNYVFSFCLFFIIFLKGFLGNIIFDFAKIVDVHAKNRMFFRD